MTRERTHDVVVVGGGLAGLAAAWDLRERDIIVLEATDRPGGRIWSEPRGAEHWLNFGAHVFGGEQSAVDRLLRETGVEARALPGRLAAVAMGERIVATGAVETYPLRLPLPLRSKLALVRAGIRLRLAVRRYGAIARPRPGENLATRQQRLLDFMDDRSFADFLGSVPDDVASIFRATVSRSSGEPTAVAAGYGIGYFHLVWDRSGGLSRGIVGGPTRLIEALAAPLGSRLALSTVVESVSHDADGVTIAFRDADGPHEIRARAAIIATPSFVTRQIVRTLPSDVAAALDAVTYGPYVVGSILTDEQGPARWDSIYAIATPGRSFSMLFNSSNLLRMPASTRTPGGSFMVYAAADDARTLGSLDHDVIARRFESDVLSLFPELQGHIRETVVRRWERGTPFPTVGRSQVQESMTRSITPLFLAGDYLRDVVHGHRQRHRRGCRRRRAGDPRLKDTGMHLRLGAIAISFLALTACGGSKSTPSTTAPSPSPTNTATAATSAGEPSASEATAAASTGEPAGSATSTTSVTTATAAGAVHVAAAGDLACKPGSEPKPGSCQSAAVGDLVRKGGYDRFLALGDIQYEDGAPGSYELGFGRDFSGLDDIISPAPGNHDYETPDGAGYHAYFGQRAGGDGRGYYSFDLGAWHVVSLNSNCDDAGGCGSESAQGQWLAADLAGSDAVVHARVLASPAVLVQQAR